MLEVPQPTTEEVSTQPQVVQTRTVVHVEETIGIQSPLAAIGSTYKEMEVSTSRTQLLNVAMEAETFEETQSRQEEPVVEDVVSTLNTSIEVVPTTTTDIQVPEAEAHEELQTGPVEGVQTIQHTIFLPPSHPEVATLSLVLMDANEAERMQKDLELMLQVVQERAIQFQGVHIMARQKEQELEEKKEAEKLLIQKLEIKESQVQTYKAECEGHRVEVQELKEKLDDLEKKLSSANEVVWDS